jgi:DNA helicase-4
VLIDEFQDFAEPLAEILRAIRGKNPFARFFYVGDDWQAINGFAGAELRYFEDPEIIFHSSSGLIARTTRLGISTNWRSDQAIVRIGNALMKGRGKGKPARARETSAPGDCFEVRLDMFEASAHEKAVCGDDVITPAVARCVAYLLGLGDGMEVVMLARANGVRQGRLSYALGKLQERVHSFFPEEDRKRITASTVHRCKGLEKSAVVVVDALAGRFPLVHPDWIFGRVFGDTIDKIIDEERRLFYVALTRAERAVIMVTDRQHRSPFLKEVDGSGVDLLDWRKLTPVVGRGVERVEVRVYNAYGAGDQLRQAGFLWAHHRSQHGAHWYRLFGSDGFDFERDLSSQPWARGRVRIEVYTEAGELLHEWPDL